MKTKIIYVLVSNENDCYLEQALVSIYSLRLYNPDANLLLLVDEETSRTLENGIRKLILNYVSKLVIVDVPFHYSKQQKSRYIKTSLRSQVIKKNAMIKILLSIYLLLSSFVLFAQGLFENDPIWRDEFNRDNVPSSMYWSYIVGMRGQESEYYTNSSNNVCVNNGKLIIRTLDEKKDKALCTSGRIHTLGKVSFLYGRLEIKAKCPTGKGIWPAFWMLPAEEGLPFGEIDIMEYIDCWSSKEYQINVHVTDKKNGNRIKKMNPQLVKADVSKFHIYTLEWYKDKLVFLLDGNLCYQFDKKEGEAWPFDKPYYLILNVAYGGWGGSCGMDDSAFPCEMKVDWIRYYKLKE